MDKYDIGGFAIWEKNDDGESVIRYRDDNIKRLTVRNLDILNVIIEFSIKYDTFITAQEIADTLKANGKLDHDRDTVKHALSRIKKHDVWGKVIVSSPTGYLIKCSAMYDDTDAADAEESVKAIDVSGSEMLSMVGAKVYEPEPVPVPKNEAPIIDNDPAILLKTRVENYISNFIRDNGQIRTYFYKNTPHDVLQVMHPLKISSEEELSLDNISFESLYKGNERHRYIISGIVGSGKSLLARRLAIEAANAFSQYRIIPILINLYGFSETNKSLYEIVQAEYESYVPEYNKDSNNDLTFYCQQGSVLLLLDGLDELNPSVKDAFIQKLKAFMRSYGNNTIIMFTRPIGSFVEFESFKVLELSRMINDEPLNLTKELLCLNRQEDIEVFENYLHDTHKTTLFYSMLYGNPLFLSIFCSNHKYYFNNENPKLSEDIDSFIKYVTGEDHFVQHKRFSKFMLIPSELDYELSNFCIFLLMHDCYFFDASVVYKCWEFFGADDNTKIGAGNFLDDLCREYGLIRFVEGKYEFIDDIIPSYYCAKCLIRNGIELKAIKEIVSNCSAFSVDNILNLLFEMDNEEVSKCLYYMYFGGLYAVNSNAEYEKFLLNIYPVIHYYVGEEDYKIYNHRSSDIYEHMVKDWKIAEDINHLAFPPIESLKKTPVIRVDENIAKEYGLPEGKMHKWGLPEYELKKHNIKPAGYIYQFETKDIFKRKNKSLLPLRNILLSKDFPLRREYAKALALCDRIEKDV